MVEKLRSSEVGKVVKNMIHNNLEILQINHCLSLFSDDLEKPLVRGITHMCCLCPPSLHT